MLMDNKECEQRVLAELNKTPEANHTSLEGSTTAVFSKINILFGLLQAFSKVRKYPKIDKKINRSFIIPKKKGNKEEEDAGVSNLIKVAHDIQMDPIIMTQKIHVKMISHRQFNSGQRTRLVSLPAIFGQQRASIPQH